MSVAATNRLRDALGTSWRPVAPSCWAPGPGRV